MLGGGERFTDAHFTRSSWRDGVFGLGLCGGLARRDVCRRDLNDDDAVVGSVEEVDANAGGAEHDREGGCGDRASSSCLGASALRQVVGLRGHHELEAISGRARRGEGLSGSLTEAASERITTNECHCLVARDP